MNNIMNPLNDFVAYLGVPFTPEIALAIIGYSLASVSIVLIYVMFSLQRWSEKVSNLLLHSITISKSTAPQSFERGETQDRISELSRRFPKLEVYLFGAIIFTLVCIGIIAAVKAKSDISLWLSVTPQAVLVLTYVVFGLATRTSGIKELVEAREYLGEENS